MRRPYKFVCLDFTGKVGQTFLSAHGMEDDPALCAGRVDRISRPAA